MGFELEGQNFIVTGAARGIGLAISQRLNELGAKVAGWDLDQKRISQEPCFSHRVKVDVTNEKNVNSAARETLEHFGKVHGLIANAGVNGPTKPVWEYDLEEWERVLSVDLTGVFLTTRAVLNHFREQEYGRIVIVASVAGKEGNPGAAPYGAAKAGVIGYAKGLARELLPSRITVNCLAPAITETELLEEMSAAYIEDKKSRIPMERFCTPEEIADMAAWVVSPRCSFTTGQIFDLTGGRATY
jgi:3-oxoacyl-[acyl-carrier protein] reductase